MFEDKRKKKVVLLIFQMTEKICAFEKFIDKCFVILFAIDKTC